MSRKRFNVVTIAVMVAILALGGLGLGYALWTTSVNVSVSASTGSANVDIQSTGTRIEESMRNEADTEWIAATFTGDGGVPYADCSITVNDGNNATITVNNMFPGYLCEIYGTIQNTGTVPVEALDGTDGFTVTNHDSGDEWFDNAGGQIGGYCEGVIQPQQGKECHISVWLPRSADNSTMNQSLSINVQLTFQQATP